MKLELIHGQVNLVITKGSSDPVFENMDKGIAGIGVVAAAATGQLGSAALASASQGAEVDIDLFTCVVNDLRLFGHLHRVEFKDGDEMEFVIERYLGRGSVQGARSTTQRLIWMRPYQTRGLLAQRKNNNKWRYITALSCAGAATAFFQFSDQNDSHAPILFYFGIYLAIFLIVWGISFIVTRRFHKFSVIATEVLGAFGCGNPAAVDLPALSKEAEKKWQSEKAGAPQCFQPWRFRY